MTDTDAMTGADGMTGTEGAGVPVRVLRVFADADGRYGNPLGVVLDGARVPGPARQPLTAGLGYSETVFVDDPDSGRVQIFTPAAEISAPGHPLVGTAWLLGRERGTGVGVLRPVRLGEPVPRSAGPATGTVDLDPRSAPDWELVELEHPAAVDGARPPKPGEHWQRTMIWSWADRAAGTVRARTFAHAWGVEEDEACGSAAVRLAASLGRGLTVASGRGSVIGAALLANGRVRLEGRVVEERTRTVAVAP
ncbi:PhzF family phenazine biosynthesis protein [Kitasatospora sp. NPDC093806]|uniref:PhzF family phenazine biosynthesis protein n=1 Tax=Kitasatospora sp. NPDC093806 TaxID=3155075 RepID=UPI00342E0ADA